MTATLGASSVELARTYDAALYDLDGVLYIGTDAVPGAVDSVAAAIALGQRAVYVTNNAGRTPESVAEHLATFGLPVSATDVVTSAVATADYLSTTLRPGARVLAVGGPGVAAALAGAQFVPLDPLSPEAVVAADAVVMGFGPELTWRHLAITAAAVRRGVPFIATNGDRTVPTAHGPAPGNGMLVAAVAAASRPPDAMIGKPAPAMFRTAASSVNAERPLVVGDRLDTDIEGAVAAGMDSLLVLTGVTSAIELVLAPPQRRPTYVGGDLGSLLDAHRAPEPNDGWWRLGAWSARRLDDRVIVDHTGPDHLGPLGEQPDPVDGVRVACAASWGAADGAADPRSWQPPRSVDGLPDLPWTAPAA